MGKNNIPLDLLQAMQPVIEKYKDQIELIEADRTLYEFRGKGEQSEFYFKIFPGFFPKRDNSSGKIIRQPFSKADFTFHFPIISKPFSKSIPKSLGFNLTLKKVPKRFAYWASMVQEYQKSSTIFEHQEKGDQIDIDESKLTLKSKRKKK